MTPVVTEATYPIDFQKQVAEKLGEYIRQRQCINIVGMKRVGISNFLRFFLTHKDIIATYISKTENHIFISVDLNDLVEQEIYPFWTLTFKRILDASEEADLPQATKTKIADLFEKSIQFNDLFFVIDSIRQSLVLIVEGGFFPTLFFLRFDRLKETFNPSFFDNLQGLRDATNGNLAYIFTSYRSLVSIFPGARSNLSVFSQTLYVKPVAVGDLRTVYEAYCKRYKLELPSTLVSSLMNLIGGYMQYLQLGMIVLNENQKTVSSEDSLKKVLLSDERIVLQSEELWESLSIEEQHVLVQMVRQEELDQADQESTRYLWDTGIIVSEGGKLQVFSPLFASYVAQIEEVSEKKKKTTHLTRKENLLYTLLKFQLGEICERESIIEYVWPESQEFGVSDWAIDRLVARVRLKLKDQDAKYEIQTVRTRGYKLVPLKS